MDLSNLKIHFLGDSITQGYFAETKSSSYVGRFQSQYPNATIRNYGVGGSCISNTCVWNVEDMRARAKRMEPDADLIVVCGGSNDFFCLTNALRIPSLALTTCFWMILSQDIPIRKLYYAQFSPVLTRPCPSATDACASHRRSLMLTSLKRSVNSGICRLSIYLLWNASGNPFPVINLL